MKTKSIKVFEYIAYVIFAFLVVYSVLSFAVGRIDGGIYLLLCGLITLFLGFVLKDIRENFENLEKENKELKSKLDELKNK